jgi:hypothetical protein
MHLRMLQIVHVAIRGLTIKSGTSGYLRAQFYKAAEMGGGEITPHEAAGLDIGKTTKDCAIRSGCEEPITF